MKGFLGDLHDRFFTAQGLNQTFADPRFQVGIGLLGRRNMPFGQALGRTMADMNAYQAQFAEMQQRAQEAKSQERLRSFQMEKGQEELERLRAAAQLQAKRREELAALPESERAKRVMEYAAMDGEYGAFSSMLNGMKKPNPTEFDKRLNLLQTDPEAYERMYPSKDNTGTSQRERALRTLADAKLKEERGIPLTREEQLEVFNAKSIIQTPTVRLGPDGALIGVTPGLPNYGAADPAMAAGGDPQPAQDGLLAGAGSGGQGNASGMTIDPLTKPKSGFAAQDEETINNGQIFIKEGQALLAMLEENPAIGGGLGAAFEQTSGYLGQGADIANAFNIPLVGSVLQRMSDGIRPSEEDQATVTQFRSRGRAWVQDAKARILKETGKISDKDQQILDKASGIFDNAKDSRQISEAITELTNYTERRIAEARERRGETPTVKAGSEEDGYRFKGGDPSRPENWEKI